MKYNKKFVIFLFIIIVIGCSNNNIAPDPHFELSISSEDVPELMNILVEFSKSEDFTFEDFGAQMPPKEGRIITFNRYKQNPLNTTKLQPSKSIITENALKSLILKIPGLFNIIKLF